MWPILPGMSRFGGTDEASVEPCSPMVRLLHLTGIGLFLVALMTPAFEFANGFGAESTTPGWQAFELAGWGAILGFTAGVFPWIAAIGALVLNLSFLGSVIRGAWRRNQSAPSRFTVNVVGPALWILSLFICVRPRDYPSSSNGPTQMHYGAYLWLMAMWSNWIARVWSRG